MATYCQRKSQELCSIMKDMFYNNFCNFTDIVKTHIKFEPDKKKSYFGDNGEEKLDNIIERYANQYFFIQTILSKSNYQRSFEHFNTCTLPYLTVI